MRSRTPASLFALATTMILLSVPASRAHAGVVSTFSIAHDGLPSPDGNGSFGTYFDFGEPCVNDSGQVAFAALLTGTAAGSADNNVLCRGTRAGAPVLIAREGALIPDGPGMFGAINFRMRQYAMNDSGRVAFVTPLTGTAGGSADNSALYSAINAGAYWLHARRGQSVPGTDLMLNGIFPPQINDQPPAAVAFFASLGTGSSQSVVYTSRLGVFTAVSWLGQSAPDATSGSGFNGALFSYPYGGGDPPALRRNANEVALYAHLWGTSNASIDDDGIFRASPDGFHDLARGNQSAPGGGTYQEMASSPVYNANGVASFNSYLKPVPSAGEIIALDWPGGGDVVAYTGEPAADGNGRFSTLYEPSLNNQDAVSFRVILDGTTGGGFDDDAIYYADSSLFTVPGLENQVAREGLAPPEGNGVFADFGRYTAINDRQQVLFTATLRGTAGGSSDTRGLYLRDPFEGVIKLMRTGDVIDGRHVMDFSTLTERDFGGYRVLNHRGEAVARVRFVEGGGGIYLFRFERTVAVEPRAPRPGVGLALNVGPNPSRGGSVKVWFAVAPGDSRARIAVLDLAGREVRTLSDGAAAHDGLLRWDLTDAAGRAVPAGVYFVTIETPSGTRARRVVCAR